MYYLIVHKAHFTMLKSTYRHINCQNRLTEFLQAFHTDRFCVIKSQSCFHNPHLTNREFNFLIIMSTKNYIFAHLSVVFLLTGWCPKHWIDSWKWCCWCNGSADYLHIPWPGVHSHWLLCEQWIHRPRAPWKSTDQARLHTGRTNGWFLDTACCCQCDCLMLISLVRNSTLDNNSSLMSLGWLLLQNSFSARQNTVLLSSWNIIQSIQTCTVGVIINNDIFNWWNT